ncbi:NTP transferase domain-containing protein [Zunongwangia sp. H14]|uniref:nucleotidyltransferase family protein n=1 Tax=Zunongwangia sp. H14 TaxID=3240792 RepID=UPI003563B880
MGKTGIIIIAAGASRRMENTKQLLQIGEETMLGKAIKQATASVADEVIVVLGANSDRITAKIEHFPAIILINENWRNGLGSSIATGIKYFFQNKKKFEAVLVMLGDQPLMDSAYLNQLLEVYKENPSKIVATKYPKSAGVPAVFPKKYFKELSLLAEDKGAKNILARERSSLIVLDAGDRILDIDTPQDYKQLQERLD